jgi:hypothetical protein
MINPFPSFQTYDETMKGEGREVKNREGSQDILVLYSIHYSCRIVYVGRTASVKLCMSGERRLLGCYAVQLLSKTDVSEELGVSIIRVTGIGELGTLAVTSNRRRLLVRLTFVVHRFLSP